MPVLPFACIATPLTDAAVQNAIDTLGIDPPTFWAILRVETLGCGYLASWRPQILFERHVFSRLTGGVWDAIAPDVSNPVPGGYGAGGDNQYARLGKAYNLNQNDPADPSIPPPTRNAALQAASWGVGQVLGENATDVGFASVQDMVMQMCLSEDRQVAAVVNYILANNLQDALQAQDWATYAAEYNGPDYAKNNYDVQLSQYYALYQSAASIPDLTVRAGQLLLLLLGYDPMGVDGVQGPHTLAALHNFQAAQGQALTVGIDATVVQSLNTALPQPQMLNLG